MGDHGYGPLVIRRRLQADLTTVERIKMRIPMAEDHVSKVSASLLSLD